MGGTFDPVHIGHLAAASEVMAKLKLDEVVFVPTGVSSHKPDRAIVDKEHRHNMVQLATGSNPRFTVSRVDLDRAGPTYTKDTLDELHQVYPDAELFFIIGADSATHLHTWHNTEALFSLATFVAVTRYDHPAQKGAVDERVVWCPLPQLQVSSTEIRRRISVDEPVWYWLGDSVLTYIGKHDLYGANWDYLGGAR